MEFTNLLAEATNEVAHTFSQATIASYAANLRIFDAAYSDIRFAPSLRPLTPDKVMAGMQSLKNRGLSASTIFNVAAALSHLCRVEGIPNIMVEEPLASYMRSLGKSMRKHLKPNRKEPITPQMLQKMLESTDFGISDSRMLFVLISLGYFGFLRASELKSLKRKNIEVRDGRILIEIESSKTDSTGKGAIVAIADGPQEYHPLRFIGAIEEFAPEMMLFEHSISSYRRWLKMLIGRIGEDPQKFSLHSLRRGGARAASIAGVPDSLIKAHGRWKSECVSLYTLASAVQAGEAIGETL
jgi:integrase